MFAISESQDSNAIFCITKTYPKKHINGNNDVDERVVELEIQTETPLPIEFYDELMNLVSSYL